MLDDLHETRLQNQAFRPLDAKDWACRGFPQKSGGVRTIIATNKDDRWFFLYGFEKSVKSNISQQDEDDLKLIGSKFLRLNDTLLAAAIKSEQLWEIEL